ncbi:MAG: hypothetical protein KF819_31165 [Labilithrix sp.]|nr:hypothetical protein [Labilithrix sp.]
MSDGVYEMFWDCKYCGQKKLLGLTHRFCATCGAPQDPTARYFPPENEKVAAHQHVYVGADVHCPACKNPMSRAAKCCTSCGSPLHAGAQVALHGAPPVRPPMPAQPKPKSSALKVFGIIAAVVGGLLFVVIALLVVAAFWTRDGTFEVTGHEWERTIAVERLDNVRKSVWCDSVPAGAREISRRKEERSTNKIPDGETCQTVKKDNGDGTYRQTRECQTKYKEEPVMDWRCEIEVAEWRSSRKLAARGASPNDPPKWPPDPLKTGTCLGCEREAGRNEKYTVKFRDTKANEDVTCTLPEAKWKTFEKASRWKGKVGVVTDRVECDGLQPN